LTAYPENPAEAPPQDLRAVLQWTSRTPIVRPNPVPLKPVDDAPPQVVTLSRELTPPGTVVRGDYLSSLLGRREIPWTLVLVGIGVAFALGAMHAMTPGHGKTMVAAYLVGTRGTLKHAAILGASVTFTHTVSVFGLGLVTLFLSEYVVPERLYPVLGALSGMSIVLVGGSLLIKRLRRLRGHSHGHHHHHHHHDHDHGHDHEHGPGDITMASLIALGASGGLVPCPSALVLLLSAIALGRTSLGLLLLIGFSLGLATVLIAIGGLVVYAKHLLPSSGKIASSPAMRFLPVASAAVVMGIGLVMTAASLG
jgi:ABC-type nickel/cobalt efflux system permease component RcnA